MNDIELILTHLEKIDRDMRDHREESRLNIKTLKDDVNRELGEVKKEVKSLNEFKFRVYGIASFLSAVIGYLVSYFKANPN